MLCDYAHTYSDAVIRYHVSDMSLYCDTDVDFLVQPNAWSCYSGYFYLGNEPPPSPIKPKPRPYVPVLIVSKTLCGVLDSVSEAKTGGSSHNSQMEIIIRQNFTALEHLHNPTPIKTDNSTPDDFVNNNIEKKLSKTWNMWWYSVQDCSVLDKLRIYWDTA